MQSIFDQIFAFLVTIGIGFLAGILFDIYRVIRGLWNPRRLGTYIGDILFWIVMTIVVFTLLLVGNWGEIRIYVFIGIAAGAYLYVRLLSERFQKIIRKSFIFTKKLLTKLWKVISWPFRMILKVFLIPVGFILSGFAFGFSFIKRVLRFIGGRFKGILNFRKKETKDDDEDEYIK
jgi:spore cortex biosynthesis protein YabQ